MAEKENITHVVNQKMCNTCGACFAVCKGGAIEYKETVGGYFFPYIDNEACTNCGLCYSVCPGVKFGQSLMERMPDDPFTGRALEAFIGKATDKTLYENSQSGGLVSALLVHAFQAGLADVAVTVAMDWGNPPRPKARLTKSVDEIILAQKSKYCPVPTLSVLKDAENTDQKIVLVGTSCQVHGLFNTMDMLPRLKERISLIIGLICDRVMTYAALDFLIYSSKLANHDKKKLLFRDKSCGGYPGNVHIQSLNGENEIMPAKARMRIKDLFTPVRCRICFDKMNIFSDIVAGDPWGIADADLKSGESIAILRTIRGQNFFQQAIKSKFFSGREISCQDIHDGQGIAVKRQEWSGYAAAWKKLGHQLPDYGDTMSQKVRDIEANQYLARLQYSISLDKHNSRVELLRSTKMQLFKNTLRRLLLIPARLLKKLLHRIKTKF